MEQFILDFVYDPRAVDTETGVPRWYTLENLADAFAQIETGPPASIASLRRAAKHLATQGEIETRHIDWPQEYSIWGDYETDPRRSIRIGKVLAVRRLLEPHEVEAAKQAYMNHLLGIFAIRREARDQAEVQRR